MILCKAFRTRTGKLKTRLSSETETEMTVQSAVQEMKLRLMNVVKNLYAGTLVPLAEVLWFTLEMHVYILKLMSVLDHPQHQWILSIRP